MKNSMMVTELDDKQRYFKIGTMYNMVFIEIDGNMWVESYGTIPGMIAATGNLINGTEKHGPVCGSVWETLGQIIAPGMGMCRQPPIPSPQQVREHFTEHNIKIGGNPIASALGSIKSEAKTAANRLNAAKPRPGAQGKPKPRKPKTD